MASFPNGSSFVRGHGVTESLGVRQRMHERHKRIIEANIAIYRRKTVLDLASHNGRWTYAALAAGAEFVLGIEGRRELIERGIPEFANIGPGKYHFLCGDVFDQRELAQSVGRSHFDTVLCLGLFYHIAEHYRLIRLMRSFNPSAILFDSSFVKSDARIIRFGTEDPNDPSKALPESERLELAMRGVPSLGFMQLAATISGYAMTIIPWRRNEVEYPDYVNDYLDTSRDVQRFTILWTAKPDKPAW